MSNVILQEQDNPLLSIDTGFRSYLNAYTRSCKSHLVGGALDYAFDSDFAVRQKVTGLQGWTKLSKAILTQDISEEAKYLFSQVDQAGSLKFPEIYEMVKLCAERLELNLPTVFVREDTERPLIYSIASEVIEPCIVLSLPLVEMCTPEELQLLIGCECGRIQNKHCVFSMAYTYFAENNKAYHPIDRSYSQAISPQIKMTISEWLRLGDVTADRAGMICMDRPERFAEVLAGIFKKGYIDFYGRDERKLDFAEITAHWRQVHTTPARSIVIPPETPKVERRLIAAMEFANCEVLFRWREDLNSADIHTVNGQVFDIRSNIIIGTAQPREV